MSWCARLVTFIGLSCLFSSVAFSASFLNPGDPIRAFDFDFSIRSSYPGAEGPENAVDELDFTKYLNFGQKNSGIIIEPAQGLTTVRSMVFTTANDAPGRDPASWRLYGTNDPVTSLDNSDGSAENWTLIDAGVVNLPDDRFTSSPPIPVNNSTSYSAFRLVFPTVKQDCGANSMQIADIYFYSTSNGTGPNQLSFLDNTLAIHRGSTESNYPCAESPANAIDGSSATKYLNFGRENSGFIVTPSVGSRVLRKFQITTANDFAARDPAEWSVWGTNDAITSPDNSQGNLENWTLIDSGTVDLPLDRFTAGEMVTVNNNTAFSSYRMAFTAVRDEFGANSVQFSEIQFFDDGAAVLGDFNNDGFWNCADVNALTAVIAAGTNQAGFDLNGDNMVNLADLDVWLIVGGAQNPAATNGNPFLKGDATLDGVVDGSDFGVWNANKFTANTAWCSGNFNGDTVVDGSDFGVWNANKFQSSADGLSVVPEPVAPLTCLLVGCGLFATRRGRGTRATG